MLQVQVLSGALAGTEVVARRFPFRIGRDPADHLRLELAGVWAQHATVHCDWTEGLRLEAHAQALTLLNGQAVQRAGVRNGDLLTVGEVRLRLWLSPTRQTSLRWREGFTWVGLAAVVVLQVLLLRGLLN